MPDCPNCNEPLAYGDVFCGNCGLKLTQYTNSAVPMQAAQPLPAAGWYPDPGDPSGSAHRYWDGTRWTQFVQPH